MLKDIFKEALEDSKSDPIFKKVFRLALNEAILNLAKDDIYLTIVPSKELFSRLKDASRESLVTDIKGVDWTLSPEGLMIAGLREVITRYLHLPSLMIKSVEEDIPLVSFHLTNDLTFSTLTSGVSITEEAIVELYPKDIETISFGDSDGVIDLSLIVSALVESVHDGIEQGRKHGIEDATEDSPGSPKPETVIKVNEETEEVIDRIVRQMEPLSTIVDIASLSMAEFIESGHWLKVAVTEAYQKEFGLSSNILTLKRGNNGGYGFINEGSDYFIWMDVAINGKKVTLTIPFSSILLSGFLYEGTYQVGDINSVVSHVVRRYMDFQREGKGFFKESNRRNLDPIEKLYGEKDKWKHNYTDNKPVNTHSSTTEVTGKDTAKVVSLVNFRKTPKE